MGLFRLAYSLYCCLWTGGARRQNRKGIEQVNWKEKWKSIFERNKTAHCCQERISWKM